jgi:hypothetical protein
LLQPSAHPPETNPSQRSACPRLLSAFDSPITETSNHCAHPICTNARTLGLPPHIKRHSVQATIAYALRSATLSLRVALLKQYRCRHFQINEICSHQYLYFNTCDVQVQTLGTPTLFSGGMVETPPPSTSVAGHKTSPPMRPRADSSGSASIEST